MKIRTIFFLGIGGIGMSALARYYHIGVGRMADNERMRVCGYDRTPSPLTRELEREGICVTYEDDARMIDEWGLEPSDTLVVRTPAVPEDSAIYTRLREQGFVIKKRAEVLGAITRTKKALCVAGTHGKTTTSTMLAHIMANGPTSKGVNAFLGGISMNYETNLLVAPESDYVVVEADEYDRSFHQLTPYISVVTAVDADHLDIYGTAEAYREAFTHYTSLITGALVIKQGIALLPRLKEGVKCYTYGMISCQSSAISSQQPDFYADHIRVGEGQILFDFHTPDGVVADVSPGVPVWVNIENAVAAMAVAWLVMDEDRNTKGEWLRKAMAGFKGVMRRFNIHVNTPRVVYIDDYAHHPDEINTAIQSVRRLYPDRRLIGVFQPHLYTRTRDFAADFRRVLGSLDECWLLPIYPARELPIEGVTSELLGDCLAEKKDLCRILEQRIAASEKPVVVMTIGAGDIDRLVPEVTERLLKIDD